MVRLWRSSLQKDNSVSASVSQSRVRAAMPDSGLSRILSLTVADFFDGPMLVRDVEKRAPRSLLMEGEMVLPLRRFVVSDS